MLGVDVQQLVLTSSPPKHQSPCQTSRLLGSPIPPTKVEHIVRKETLAGSTTCHVLEQASQQVKGRLRGRVQGLSARGGGADLRVTLAPGPRMARCV